MSPLLQQWTRAVRLAYRAAAVSVEEAIEKVSRERNAYQPIASPTTQGTTDGPESAPATPSSTTPTHIRPRSALRTRWGKMLLATAVVVLVLIAASMISTPSPSSSPPPPVSPDKAAHEATQTALPAPATTPQDRPSSSSDSLTLLESARASMAKEAYVDAILRNPIEGLLDPLPIRKKCDATKFQPGLVWHCELVNGGIGNVGNMWLNCLRYAVEAGATTIILPRINARNKESLGVLDSNNPSVGLSTLYDVDFFLAAWKDACPQMTAVLSDENIKNLPPTRDSPAIRANSVANFERKGELIVDPTDWRSGLDAWLTANAKGYKEMSPEKPLRVVQRLALSHWNREWHDHDFAVSFPRLFRFPDSIRRLAAAAMWSMEKSAGKPMVADAILFPELIATAANNDTSSIVTSLGTRRLLSQGYLGVHLRVAADAAKASWPGYEAQAPAYLDEAQRRNLTIVYLATGSEEHRLRFRADAAARNIQVVTKEDLLADEELIELGKLSWDQQAIVDFEVLLHSSYFAGFVRSSFSWVIAIRRSILPEAGTPQITKRQVQAIPRLTGEARRRDFIEERDNTAIVEKYRDGLSVVVGRFDAMTIMGIWP